MGTESLFLELNTSFLSTSLWFMMLEALIGTEGKARGDIFFS